MKKWIVLLVFCVLCLTSFAQVIDVYNDKEYDFSQYVFSENIDREYTSGKVEIIQSIIKEGTTSQKKIESELYQLVVNTLKDESQFFKIYFKVGQIKDLMNENSHTTNGYDANAISSLDFKFNRIEIELISVVNNHGVYRIGYEFKYKGNRYHVNDINVHDMYIADYNTGNIKPIKNTLNKTQQEILARLVNPKLEAMYLLQSEKLDLKEQERIRAIENDSKINLELLKTIDFAEAEIYPFFTGILIEFPRYSKSSRVFDHRPFQFLIREYELGEVLNLFPEFKAIFKVHLKPLESNEIRTLNEDSNFGILHFLQAPKELEMLKYLDFDSDLCSLEINNYQVNDSLKTYLGGKYFTFDKQQNVSHIQEVFADKRSAGETTYSYNQTNQLVYKLNESMYEQLLTLYNYREGLLDYTSQIKRETTTNNGTMENDFDMTQNHYWFNNHTRYTLNIDLLKDYNPRSPSIEIRYINGREYCNSWDCILRNENGRVVGVRKKKYGQVDLRTNENNQPLEFYSDRYKYFFDYDSAGRIQTFLMYDVNTISRKSEYQYTNHPEQALIIKDTNPVLQQEYTFKFW